MCFAFAAAPHVFINTPALSSLDLPQSLAGIWPSKLLSPAWTCFVFLFSCMIPRAIQAHKWYHRTFGDRYPKDRKAVIPWVI